MNPILFCSYTRKYFISFDKKTRITIDRNLEYAPINQISLFKKQKVKLENIMIIEIKASTKNYLNFVDSGQYQRDKPAEKKSTYSHYTSKVLKLIKF